MARIDVFMASCEQRGSATLEDHLTDDGYTDPAERRSLRAQAGKALMVGGAYRHLAERGIIKPSADSRGKEPLWAVGLAKEPNKYSIALQSKALADMRAMAEVNDYPAVVKDALENVIATNITGRKGAVVNNSMVTLIHQIEIEKTKREAAEHSQKVVENVLTDMRDMMRRITGGSGGSGSGSALAPA